MQQVITVFTLADGLYEEKVFQAGDRIISSTLPDLALTTEMVMGAGQ